MNSCDMYANSQLIADIVATNFCNQPKIKRHDISSFYVVSVKRDRIIAHLSNVHASRLL